MSPEPDEIALPPKRKPDPVRVLRMTLPNRSAQDAYHRELEKVLGIEIYRFMGKWEWRCIRTKE